MKPAENYTQFSADFMMTQAVDSYGLNEDTSGWELFII